MRIRWIVFTLIAALTGVSALAAPDQAEGWREKALTAFHEIGLFENSDVEETILEGDASQLPYDRIRYTVRSADNMSIFNQICDENEERISFALQVEQGVESELAQEAIRTLLCVLEPDVFDQSSAADALTSLQNMRAYQDRLAAQLDAVNGTQSGDRGYGMYFTEHMVYELTHSYFYARTRSCYPAAE